VPHGKLACVSSFDGFFTASASVAGALTGLLFVALSVTPERMRNEEHTLEHQAVAATAFTALVDALFVSLAGLTPGKGGTNLAGLILGLVGLSSSAGLAWRLWNARGGRAQFSHRWPVLLTLIIGTYAAQCILALTSSVGESDNNAVTFIMIMFGVGIIRSWELLGLSGGGLFDLLSRRLERPLTHDHDDNPEQS
jgi:Kef-type K+ transport system membrane component KefB